MTISSTDWTDIVLRTNRVSSVEQAAKVLADVQWLFGFRAYYVFDRAKASGLPFAQSHRFSNFTETFLSRLTATVPDFEDKIFIDSLSRLMPVPWFIDEYSKRAKLSDAAVTLFTESRLTMGVNFPGFGLWDKIRIVGFAGARKRPDRDELDQLNLLMIQMHERLSLVFRPQDNTENTMTTLEKRVLHAVSEGNRVAHVAGNLGLSTRTVQYLLDSICRKLDASSVEHAVASALRQGLIY